MVIFSNLELMALGFKLARVFHFVRIPRKMLEGMVDSKELLTLRANFAMEAISAFDKKSDTFI